MIKANELRVGNYVYDDTNTVVKIEKIHSERHALWSESEYFDFSKFDDKENMYSSIVNPIPMTEKWLLKSGAKKKKSCFVYDRFILLYSENYKFFSVGDTETGAYFTKVEFVHEWQNFIHIMNGVELVFSTEP